MQQIIFYTYFFFYDGVNLLLPKLKLELKLMLMLKLWHAMEKCRKQQRRFSLFDKECHSARIEGTIVNETIVW